MRNRNQLRAPAADRPIPEAPVAERAQPRLGTVAQAAARAQGIELVAGERIAIASIDSPAWDGLDKGLLLKAGLVVAGLVALLGGLSLAQRLLGL